MIQIIVIMNEKQLKKYNLNVVKELNYLVGITDGQKEFNLINK